MRKLRRNFFEVHVRFSEIYTKKKRWIHKTMKMIQIDKTGFSLSHPLYLPPNKKLLCTVESGSRFMRRCHHPSWLSYRWAANDASPPAWCGHSRGVHWEPAWPEIRVPSDAQRRRRAWWASSEGLPSGICHRWPCQTAPGCSTYPWLFLLTTSSSWPCRLRSPPSSSVSSGAALTLTWSPSSVAGRAESEVRTKHPQFSSISSQIILFSAIFFVTLTVCTPLIKLSREFAWYLLKIRGKSDSTWTTLRPHICCHFSTEISLNSHILPP